MKRRLFSLAALASLALAVFVAATWEQSKSVHKRIGLCLMRTRYSVHSHRGKLTLMMPAAAGAGVAAAEAEAWPLVARLRNEDISWRQERAVMRVLTAMRKKVDVAPIRGTPADRIDPRSSIRPLLDALDDPQRFAAAHVLLVQTRVPRYTALGVFGANSVTDVDYDGLHVRLLPDGAEYPNGTTTIEHRALGTWVADGSQRRLLRDQWHDRFDVPVASASHLWFAGAALLLPAAWVASWRRRASRERSGRCVRCDYDLRESRYRCPECGEPTIPDARGRSASRRDAPT